VVVVLDSSSSDVWVPTVTFPLMVIIPSCFPVVSATGGDAADNGSRSFPFSSFSASECEGARGEWDKSFGVGVSSFAGSIGIVPFISRFKSLESSWRGRGAKASVVGGPEDDRLGPPGSRGERFGGSDEGPKMSPPEGPASSPSIPNQFSALWIEMSSAIKASSLFPVIPPFPFSGPKTRWLYKGSLQMGKPRKKETETWVSY